MLLKVKRQRVCLERWKPVLGYEGLYEVSSEGRVKSFHNSKVGEVRKLGISKKGYKTVELRKNGIGKLRSVHVLVCEAFHGPKPSPNHEVNHKGKDGDKTNNRERNLEWTTRSQNAKHRCLVLGYKNNLPSGEDHCSLGKFGKENPRSKNYIMIAPNGKIEKVTGLLDFCRRQKLDASSMSALAKGNRETYKGWRCSYAS